MTDRELAGCALLPCPFCGGTDLRVYGDSPPYEMLLGGFKVQCENPNCQAGARYSGQREKAIASWNRRASSSSSAEVSGVVNGYLPRQRAVEVLLDADVPEWIAKFPPPRVYLIAGAER